MREHQIDRRQFVARTAAASAAALLSCAPARADDDVPPTPTDQQVRDYLASLVATREDIDAWLAQQAFPFSKYDPELGYLHIDREFPEGQGKVVCRYRYDALDARQPIAYADQPCRINTYGDSFTSCEQVSDGETWQEALARHFGEPVRNYGIGGYSVNQAYLRMLREEQRSPARCIVFNIYDDDHARNLHGWQRFKFPPNRKSVNPTVPHLRVDLAADQVTDCPNVCPTPESVYQLCDLDWVCERFRDDFYLRNRIDLAARRDAGQEVPARDYDDARLMRHGIRATTGLVDRIAEFAREHDKQVLFVLSYGAYTLKQFIDGGTRFDQALVDYLSAAQLPCVDLRAAHAAEAAQFKGTTDEYLARYFIGHYNPLGNVFCAFAIRDALVAMLDPKPPAFAG
jgi:hypothetical protein